MFKKAPVFESKKKSLLIFVPRNMGADVVIVKVEL